MESKPIINEARIDPKAAEKDVKVIKGPADLQRLKLEKLMKNPEKPVHIPATKKKWQPKAPPEFVRDVMGSSAGAGSGEFHVYRHIRRREYSRQNYLDAEEKRLKLDTEYAAKREENIKAAEEATKRKREKRLKKKQRKKFNKKQLVKKKESASSESEDTDGNGSADNARSVSESAHEGWQHYHVVFLTIVKHINIRFVPVVTSTSGLMGRCLQLYKQKYPTQQSSGTDEIATIRLVCTALKNPVDVKSDSAFLLWQVVHRENVDQLSTSFVL